MRTTRVCFGRCAPLRRHAHLVSAMWQRARSSGSSRKLQICCNISGGSATRVTLFLVPSCLEPDAILATMRETDESASNQARPLAGGNCMRGAIWCSMLPCACIHAFALLLVASRVHCAVQDDVRGNVQGGGGCRQLNAGGAASIGASKSLCIPKSWMSETPFLQLTTMFVDHPSTLCFLYKQQPGLARKQAK